MVFSVTRCRPKSAITVPCSLVCSRYRLSRRASSSSRSRRCLRRRAARRRGRRPTNTTPSHVLLSAELPGACDDAELSADAR